MFKPGDKLIFNRWRETDKQRFYYEIIGPSFGEHQYHYLIVDTFLFKKSRAFGKLYPEDWTLFEDKSTDFKDGLM